MSEPQPIPVNGKFGNDFVAHMVVILSTDTIAEAAAKVAHHAVGKRIAPRDLPMALYMEGRRMPDDKTVAEAGIPPLSYVFVDYVE